MNAAKTAGVCLFMVGIAFAVPTFQIGTKLTWHGGRADETWFGSNENDTLFQVVFFQPSVGPTIEASYGPAWGVLTGRLDLVQASIFTAGGVAFRFFPMLGLDVILEPPTNWRVKPYVWAGVRTTGYSWMPLRQSDVYQHDRETHWRGGIGGKCRLSRTIDLFAETQLYSRDDFWEGFVMLEDGTVLPNGLHFEGIGLASVEIGARFALGK